MAQGIRQKERAAEAALSDIVGRNRSDQKLR